MDSFLRASHPRSHTRGTGDSLDHSLLSSPSFPFITLTLWPRPRHAMPPGSAITPSAGRGRGAAPALLLPLAAVTSTRLSPFRPWDHQSEKRTIELGPNHHWARDIKSGGRRRLCRPSVCPIDITTVIKVRLRASVGQGGRGEGSAT